MRTLGYALLIQVNPVTKYMVNLGKKALEKASTKEAFEAIYENFRRRLNNPESMKKMVNSCREKIAT